MQQCQYLPYMVFLQCNGKVSVCGNEHRDKILCDNGAHTSAVINCNCVTYNNATKSTYAGGCFYNCVMVMNQNHIMSIQHLPI